jgi:hypothetical protein
MTSWCLIAVYVLTLIVYLSSTSTGMFRGSAAFMESSGLDVAEVHIEGSDMHIYMERGDDIIEEATVEGWWMPCVWPKQQRVWLGENSTLPEWVTVEYDAWRQYLLIHDGDTVFFAGYRDAEMSDLDIKDDDSISP